VLSYWGSVAERSQRALSVSRAATGTRTFVAYDSSNLATVGCVPFPVRRRAHPRITSQQLGSTPFHFFAHDDPQRSLGWYVLGYGGYDTSRSTNPDQSANGTLRFRNGVRRPACSGPLSRSITHCLRPRYGARTPRHHTGTASTPKARVPPEPNTQVNAPVRSTRTPKGTSNSGAGRSWSQPGAAFPSPSVRLVSPRTESPTATWALVAIALASGCRASRTAARTAGTVATRASVSLV
jgi:hypothetical protein